MTNREFILKCIAGLSDGSLLDLWEEIWATDPDHMPIVSACETCISESAGSDCPHDYICDVDGPAWMQREAVPRRQPAN